MGARGESYEVNIFENGRKGGHFGGGRSPLSLLLGNVLQAMCGPIVFIRNQSIFSFCVGFSKNQRHLELVSVPEDKGYELNIFENGRKSGNFGELRCPLPLLLGTLLQPICGPIIFIRKLSFFSFSFGFSENQRHLDLVWDPGDKVMSSIYSKMG